MTDFTKKLSSLSNEDANIAGGKCASLGEMLNANIPVPGGFAVTTEAFNSFLEENDLESEIDSAIHSVRKEETHTVENASERIRGHILNAPIPDNIQQSIKESFGDLESNFVAVRSSATAEDASDEAWAGQLETFLNVTEEDLLERVRECWASLFTPRAIFYRFENDLHDEDISVGVAVQEMVQSDVSGVAFSVHPVTEDDNQIIIEAGYGLGEAVVSGQITPDSYVVEKDPREVVDVNINDQDQGVFRNEEGENEWQDIPKEKQERQNLTDDQILELAKIIIRIENHYGFPVDVEWTKSGNEFYIVQSRPITTLS